MSLFGICGFDDHEMRLWRRLSDFSSQSLGWKTLIIRQRASTRKVEAIHKAEVPPWLDSEARAVKSSTYWLKIRKILMLVEIAGFLP
jgi:hypothetical protein